MKEEIKSLGSVKDELTADDVYDSDAEDEKLRKLARGKTLVGKIPASKISAGKISTSNLAINNSKENIAITGSNKKYPDIPMFNGDRKQ